MTNPNDWLAPTLVCFNFLLLTIYSHKTVRFLNRTNKNPLTSHTQPYWGTVKWQPARNKSNLVVNMSFLETFLTGNLQEFLDLLASHQIWFVCQNRAAERMKDDEINRKCTLAHTQRVQNQLNPATGGFVCSLLQWRERKERKKAQNVFLAWISISVTFQYFSLARIWHI